MGRSVAIFIRLGVIACACAMLFVCVRAAHAQTSNNDGYGLIPIPAPTMPVSQAPLPPPTASNGQNFAPAPGAAPSNGGQGFAAAPAMDPLAVPSSASGMYYAPLGASAPAAAPSPYPYAQGYAAAPAYAPPVPSYAPPAQSFGPPPPGPVASASTQPYGYTPLRDQPGTSSYARAGAGANGGYLLGPGDKLHITVYGEDDLSGAYQIDGIGMVRLPLVGTLRAAGFTAPALENAIAGALAQGFLKSPRVNVEITEYRPFYIIGAVNKPGTYPYVNNMSALDAVALGGGFLDTAKQSAVFVRHEGSTVEAEVPADQMTRIWPGDVVRVKTTAFWDVMAVFAPLAAPVALAATAIH